MIVQALIAGLTLGLLSSFHCVGMCGPLALALPVQHLSRGWQALAVILYNIGRASTYALLGLLFGLAGHRLYLAGWQQAFSIAAGSLMLLLALHYFLLRNTWQPLWMKGFNRQVQRWMGYFLRSRRVSGFYMLGMANGLLPCGMVYIGLAGALSTGTAVNSTLFMTAFGMGTLPAMAALSLFGLRLSLNLRQQISKAVPYLVMAMAVILILRGMNLGIPFISPVMAQAPGEAAGCH